MSPANSSPFAPAPVQRPSQIATLLILARLDRIATHLECGTIPEGLRLCHAQALRDIRELLAREAELSNP